MRSALRIPFLACLAVTLFFAGAELLCRAIEPPLPPSGQVPSRNPMDLLGYGTGPVSEEDDLLGYRLRKDVTAGEYRLNNLGLRGPDTSLRKPDGTYRILCVGGSTTIGFGAGCDADTYPRQLEALLRQDAGNDRIEVLNAGVFGHHGLHSLLRVLGEFDALDPDLYVFLDGLNDVLAAASLSLAELEDLERNARPALVHLANPREAGLLGRAKALACRSGVYRATRRLAGLLPGRFRSTGPEDSPERRMELFLYRDNLERALAHVLARGKAAVVVDYPWIPTQAPDGRRESSAIPVNDWLAARYAFGRRWLPRANALAAGRLGVPVAATQAVFDQAVERLGASGVYADGMHFTRFGNFLLARAVREAMASMPEVQAAIGPARPAGMAVSAAP